MLEAIDMILFFLHELVRLISSQHILYIMYIAFALHKKYGGKGIHYVGGYTQTSNTLDKKDGGNVTTQEVGTYLVYHYYFAESYQQSHFNS